MYRNKNLEDIFYEVADEFIQSALYEEREISIPQVNSSFMCSIACLVLV